MVASVGSKATNCTEPVWPASVCTSLPVSTFHILLVESPEQEAARFVTCNQCVCVCVCVGEEEKEEKEEGRGRAGSGGRRNGARIEENKGRERVCETGKGKPRGAADRRGQ